MPSPDIIDFETLLAPISEEAPTGVALRGGEPAERAAFQKVKDAREVCRAAERQALNAWGEERAEVEPPDWGAVKEAALEVLGTRSKDLWIAAWLLEALIREDGFAGLRDGFRYIRELVDKYFDDGLHPKPDLELGEDLGDTTAQLTGLFDGALAPAIDQIAIAFGDDGPLTSGDYKMSAELEKLTDPAVKQARIDEGTLPLSRFEALARSETPSDFLKTNYEDAEAALTEFKQLGTLLDAKFGYEFAPPTSSLRENLEDCLARMRSLSKHVLEADDGDGERTSGEMTTTPTGQIVPGGGGGVASGRVATREDAFKVLNQVAEFFERTEPHSLIPFALRQVVGWGKMSLPDLLKELINDDGVLSDLHRRTGVPTKEEAAEEY